MKFSCEYVGSKIGVDFVREIEYQCLMAKLIEIIIKKDDKVDLIFESKIGRFKASPFFDRQKFRNELQEGRHLVEQINIDAIISIGSTLYYDWRERFTMDFDYVQEIKAELELDDVAIENLGKKLITASSV